MWGHATKESANGNDQYGRPQALSMVPPSYVIHWTEQSASHNDQISYHYPPAQAEHGRWYNNVYYGNAIPNSMLQMSKSIPGVQQLPWMIQYNKEIIPFQLRNTLYPYGGSTSSVAANAGLLAKASQLFSGVMNFANVGGGDK